ncbi:MAG: L-rhamnose mutarotase [Chloroflexota bacterium]|nr:L-rhamnose mutarotase [Chloroflexota bacterium]
MKRVGFILKVKEHKIDEYKLGHQEVWPEMLQTLRDAGWTNYSLFMREDGLLFGYVETPDFDQALAKMGESEVNTRWQAAFADFFEGLDGKNADQSMVELEEVFHLD